MYVHSESEIAAVVAPYIREHGIGQWQELYRHIESVLPLTETDLTPYRDRTTLRYQTRAQNLASHRRLISLYSDIIRIAGGFATSEYATKHNIPEIVTKRNNNRPRRTARPQTPKPDMRKGEKYIRAVWKKYIPDLAKLYDNDLLLADIRNPQMTVHAFGVKYDLIKDLTSHIV